MFISVRQFAFTNCIFAFTNCMLTSGFDDISIASNVKKVKYLLHPSMDTEYLFPFNIERSKETAP